MMPSFLQQDEVFKSHITRQAHTDELVHTLEQTSRDQILERNKQLRNNPGAMHDLSFGRQIASITFEDWEYFIRKNPDYFRADKETREKLLFDFLRFDERGKASMIVKENKHKSGKLIIK